VIVVQVLKSLDHLVSYHEHCFKRELPFAESEEVFKRRSQNIHDHAVVVTFNAEPVYLRDSDYKNVKKKDE
jgi:hypothetical protein